MMLVGVMRFVTVWQPANPSALVVCLVLAVSGMAENLLVTLLDNKIWPIIKSDMLFKVAVGVVV